MKRLIKTKNGRILMSILWGLGLSALFKKVCEGRNCIVFTSHNPKIIQDNIYKHGDKCYKYIASNAKCNETAIEHIITEKERNNKKNNKTLFKTFEKLFD